MLRNLAYLSAPTGLLTAVDRRAQDMGISRASVLWRAGLTETDWNALASSLAAVPATPLLRLLNAAGLASMIVEMPANPGQDPARPPLDRSHAGQVNALYGDLQ
jgi:hypothetical protein